MEFNHWMHRLPDAGLRDNHGWRPGALRQLFARTARRQPAEFHRAGADSMGRPGRLPAQHRVRRYQLCSAHLRFHQTETNQRADHQYRALERGWDGSQASQEIHKQNHVLLLYHGWSDPVLTPFNTLNLFTNIQSTFGTT